MVTEVEDLNEVHKGWGLEAFEHEDGNVSLTRLLLLHVVSALALLASVWRAPSLTLQPLQALRNILALLFPTVLLAYSMSAPSNQSISRGLVRGFLGFPVGVTIAMSVAIIFGAPMSLQSLSKTLYWAGLMSVLVVVPAATVLGSSPTGWHRIFATARPKKKIEIVICVAAHGAVLGAWVGAWPMPLDWDRPWQAWPISCTYGAVGGYLLGICTSLILCCTVTFDVGKQNSEEMHCPAFGHVIQRDDCGRKGGR